MPVRTAKAEWRGNFKEGGGTISTETKTLTNVAYDSASRFEDGKKTNPEELLGAAHSACYSMALALALSRDGFTVNSINTEDKVHIVKGEDGFKITKIEMYTIGDIGKIDENKFKDYAEKTKKGCPVSRALTGTEIVLNVKLK
jgi:lipoyl-dependent peroxiredoxin